MPDGRVFTAARVFVRADRIQVYVTEPAATPGQRPAILLVVDEALTEPELVPYSQQRLRHGERLECRVEAGTVWVNRGRGCGCHSPLKALRAS